ncbi:MAG: nicotinamide-nucleotide amidohydrolase family protein, partial [Abditibacteriota bacterium]|nr:nicotinamide-nucleotide amidohydrolase family protein [Abditibacteriota bacterium]
PGPPSEFIPMWQQSVKPYLLREFPPEKSLVSAILRIYGVGESAVASRLGSLLSGSEPSMATYVGKGDVLVRVTACSPEAVADGIARVRDIFGPALYSEDGSSMEETVVRLAAANNKTLATAESCTGGLVGKLLTDVAGSSAVYSGGVVSYSNYCKNKVLGVRQDTLDSVGAVSPETALEMALGARKLLSADIAVSLTGIAGPGGGTAEKPVGLVYMGVATGAGVRTEELRFAGSRDNVRLRSAMAALNAMRLALTDPRS